MLEHTGLQKPPAQWPGHKILTTKCMNTANDAGTGESPFLHRGNFIFTAQFIANNVLRRHDPQGNFHTLRFGISTENVASIPQRKARFP